MIYLGSNKIKKVYLGDTPIGRIYRGDELVYQKKVFTYIIKFISTTGVLYFNSSNGGNQYQSLGSSSNPNVLVTRDLKDYIKLTTTNKLFFYTNYNSGVTYLDLSEFSFNDGIITLDFSQMFRNLDNLETLDIRSLDPIGITYKSLMFSGCNKLTKIICKQSFKDWALANQDTINLPNAMIEGGSGVWEIVD